MGLYSKEVLNSAITKSIATHQMVDRSPNIITSQKQYSSEELDFMKAMEAFKTRNNRKFPTWSEILTVLKALGYEKTN